jgi:hypothetical protein
MVNHLLEPTALPGGWLESFNSRFPIEQLPINEYHEGGWLESSILLIQRG